ncbi:MAG TPA: ester cyclase [Kofleriaceae bacterium]|nr:ester cyclase [Kofleriaceae bacterium]
MENRRDLAGTMSTVAASGADYVTVATGERWTSWEDIREFYRGFYEAVPDLQVDVRRMTVDTAARAVVAEVVVTGTLARAYWGLAPTHRRFELNTAVFYELDRTGKLIAERSYFDKNELLESMGLIVSTKTELGRLLLILPQSPIYAMRSLMRTLVNNAWPAVRGRAARLRRVL